MFCVTITWHEYLNAGKLARGAARVASSLPPPCLALPCARRFPSWKSTGPRLTATILGHFETRRDPQMLASIACVLGSESRDGAAVDYMPQEEEEKAATYDRYLACYAERLYQWGAQGVMAEATSHQTGAFGHRSALQIRTRQRRHDMVPYLCEQGGGYEVCFCATGWIT